MAWNSRFADSEEEASLLAGMLLGCLPRFCGLWGRLNAFSSRLFNYLFLLIRMRFGASVSVEHCRSHNRLSLGRHLADLTLYESPLLAAFGDFAIESLKALSLLI